MSTSSTDRDLENQTLSPEEIEKARLAEKAKEEEDRRAAEKAKAEEEALPDQEERSVFKYRVARMQAAIHTQFVVMMMLYPTLLGFCMAARLGKFNLMVSTPYLNMSPPAAAALKTKEDLWKTSQPADIALLVFMFTFVTGVHVFLASYLVLRAPDGGPSLARVISWIPPVLFWGVTTTYFIFFVYIARYGPGKGEWISAGLASSFILGITIYMIAVPVEAEKVVEKLTGGRAKSSAKESAKEG